MLTGTYSAKEGLDYEHMLLPPNVQNCTKQGSFNVSLALSHLLFESASRPGRGFGLYRKAANAAGNHDTAVVGGLRGKLVF
jgi:hypothetical protein